MMILLASLLAFLLAWVLACACRLRWWWDCWILGWRAEGRGGVREGGERGTGLRLRTTETSHRPLVVTAFGEHAKRPLVVTTSSFLQGDGEGRGRDRRRGVCSAWSASTANRRQAYNYNITMFQYCNNVAKIIQMEGAKVGSVGRGRGREPTLSCNIHTQTPARKSYTNLQLYYFVIQICSTNCVGHGHGYECHSSHLSFLSMSLAAGSSFIKIHGSIT